MALNFCLIYVFLAAMALAAPLQMNGQPSLPPSFSVTIEANVLDKKRTSHIIEYHDAETRRARFEYHSKGHAYIDVVDYARNEIHEFKGDLHEIPDSCVTKPIPKSPVFKFQDVKELLALGTSGQTYRGQETVRGIVCDGQELEVGALRVVCHSVPCHTKDSVVFEVQTTGANDGAAAVFTGDTLFALGCGKFFEGTAADMHRALAKLRDRLSPKAVLFFGHDYLKTNHAFARSLWRGGAGALEELAKLDQYLAKWAPFSSGDASGGGQLMGPTWSEECAVNPFLRFDDPALLSAAALVHSPDDGPAAVVGRLRQLKNQFRPGVTWGTVRFVLQFFAVIAWNRRRKFIHLTAGALSLTSGLVSLLMTSLSPAPTRVPADGAATLNLAVLSVVGVAMLAKKRAPVTPSLQFCKLIGVVSSAHAWVSGFSSPYLGFSLAGLFICSFLQPALK